MTNHIWPRQVDRDIVGRLLYYEKVGEVTPHGQRADAKVDIIIPAHNEEATVFGVAETAVAVKAKGKYIGRVVVVADACIDGTAAAASAAGADVIVREGQPSKAGALTEGVCTTTAPYVCFLDADCRGLTTDHVEALIDAHFSTDATMTVGTFDYGWRSGIVSRFPWSTGQRLVGRAQVEAACAKSIGYGIEVALNEQVGLVDGKTISMVLRGCSQRTKAEKLGSLQGTLANGKMWREIATRALVAIDRDAYRRYATNVSVWRPEQRRAQRQHPVVTLLGYAALTAAASVARQREREVS